MPDSYTYINVLRATSPDGPFNLLTSIDRITTITEPFTIPEKGESVLVTVADSSWMDANEREFILGGGGTYSVLSAPTATTVNLLYLDIDDNVHAGETISAGTQIAQAFYTYSPPPSGVTYYFKLALITANGLTKTINTVFVANQTETSGELKWVAAPFKSVGNLADQGWGTAVDSSNNAYIVGAKANAFFLEKYNSSGVSQWLVNAFGGTAYGKCVNVDTSNNVYVGGYIYGGADVGGGYLPGYGGYQVPFIAKYDSNGNHLWSKSYPCPVESAVNSVVIDKVNNFLYAIGIFSGDMDYSGTGAGAPIITATGGALATFVMKVNLTTGAVIWIKQYGQGSNFKRNCLTLDTRVNPPALWLIGSFSGDINFGGGAISSTPPDVSGSPTEDAYLVKLDSAGNHIFSTHFTGNGGEGGFSIACSPINGNVYIGVRYTNSINIGGNTYVRGGAYWDAILGCFNSSGVFQWEKVYAGTAGFFDDINSIAVDVQGNIFVTGNTFGTLDFGNGVSISAANDVYIVKYNSAGLAQWAKVFGNYSQDTGYGIAVLNGYVYTTGFFYGSVDFGGGNVINSGVSSRAFLTKHKT